MGSQVEQARVREGVPAMNAQGAEVRLNIGAGETHLPGFHNIDLSPRAEISLDLGREPLPFEDGSVDLVFSYHTLEHVENYLFALGEIHRVLKPGGWLLLGVPYVTLTEFHLVNPYHRHNFSEHSFDFFDPAKLQGSAVEDPSIRFRKVFHRFHYMEWFHLCPPPLRGWCRRHLFNVVRKIDVGLVKLGGASADASLESEMRTRFDACLRLRVPYDRRETSGRLAGWPGRSVLRTAWSWWHGHG